MKLLLVTCLVATALAAPAVVVKRNILPGDSRYDAKHHEHHTEKEHHENEVEISKALGGYTGFLSSPDINFGFTGLEGGDYFGNTQLLKAAVGSEAFKVENDKTNQELKSNSEDSIAVSKDEEVTVEKSDEYVGSNVATADQSVAVVSETGIEEADKESSKNTEEINVETKSASDVSSSDAKNDKEAVTIESKSAAKAIDAKDGVVTDILGTPFFDSSFGSDFASIGQSGFDPSFYSFRGYTPGLDGFNTNYEYFTNYDTQPFSFDAYSGLNDGLKGITIKSSIPSDFDQFSSADFSHIEPYLPPFLPSFSPAISVSEAAQPTKKVTLVKSDSEPTIEKTKQQSSSPVISQSEKQLFKDYSLPSFGQPTATSFNSGSFSGISQLTDANGGYIY